MKYSLQKTIEILEKVAEDSLGLNFYPIEFQWVPHEVLMSVSSGPFPIRFHHWTYGRDYYALSLHNRLGLSHLYESFFYGKPSYAFIKDSETPMDQILVIAHCIGHGDFSTNNSLFKYGNKNIVKTVIRHAERISKMETLYGEKQVEETLDLLFGLYFLVDTNKSLNRAPYPEPERVLVREPHGEFDDLLLEKNEKRERWQEINKEFPPFNEYDLLWFLYHYADAPDWKKEIIKIFREEMHYVTPIIKTKVMNEGWASFIEWLLVREADQRYSLFDESEFINLIKTHAIITSVAPSMFLSPYALGFALWKKLFTENSEDISNLLEIRKNYEDIGFIRDFLNRETVEDMGLFEYQRKNAITTVTSKDIEEIRSRLMNLMAHMYSPNVYLPRGGWDRNGGTLRLHFKRDTERDLDLTHAENILKALEKFWGNKIILEVETEDPQKILILEAVDGTVERKPLSQK